MRYSRANIDARDEGDVDEMMMEYMTALMQQAALQDGTTKLHSTPHSTLKLIGRDGLPRLIVPLVIDEIFETVSKVTGQGEHTSMAADSMLLHPIGDNQISIATLHAHDQIVRSDLDLQVNGGFVGGFAGTAGEATVSGVVEAILSHCAVDEERGVAQVFTVQRDRWGRCDAAAEHVVAQLRSIGSSFWQVQRQTKRGDAASTGNVRRILGTPSSLKAGKGSSVSLRVYLISIIYPPLHLLAPLFYFFAVLQQDELLPSLLAPLLHQHLTQSDSTSDETQFHSAGVGNSFTTDITAVSASSSMSPDRRPAGAGAGGGAGSTRHKGQPSSRREFSSGTSKTDTSMASRSVYHSAETTGVRGFKTSTAESTAGLNSGEDGAGRSVTDSESMWSFVTAEEMK
jgi:hypothetical protein